MAQIRFGEKNVGMIDRTIRIVIGFFVMALAAKYLDAPLSLLVELIGFIFIATGSVGTCALYSLFGINTAGADEGQATPSVAATPAKKGRRKKDA